MKHLSIACLNTDRDKVLRALQKFGQIMLIDSPDSAHTSLSSGQYVQQMEKLLVDLKPYIKQKGFFQDLPEADMATLEDMNVAEKEAVEYIHKLFNQLKNITQEQNALVTLRNSILPWVDLNIPPAKLGDLAYVSMIAGTVPISKMDLFEQLCDKNACSYEKINQDKQVVYVVYCCDKLMGVLPIVESGFERFVFPAFSGTVKEYIHVLDEKISECDKTIQRLHKELEKRAQNRQIPAKLCEQYRMLYELESAPIMKTEVATIIQGWIPEDKCAAVEPVIRKVTDIFDIEFRAPGPGEEVPTELRNTHVISQFEGITNMFSIPEYGGIDPNAVMAPWYWIIFGMMMGDAGYGLLMALLIFIVKKIMKPKGNTLKLINVLLYSSITTIICGILFGSYFGQTWNPILFSPLDDPVKMLIVTLGLGIAHIFTGLFVKIYADIKNGHILDAIFDEVSWILIISGIVLIFIPAMKLLGIVIAAIGACIILLTAGRAKRNLLGKIAGGFTGLYGITNYLSDILSYSRILALSLATGVVGMVMNMLAGMIQGSVIGFILSIIIYVVGHIFNLALGLLSAYVHDCRLQYIEFYGKFYGGGGRLFKPFSINPKYIKIKNDGGK